MRLWTLHPCYLDHKGLVAAWREALLAQKVLSGATKGYRHHPQLLRFRATPNPLDAIGAFLRGIEAEARSRGYCFDQTKIVSSLPGGKMFETRGQLLFEWAHLQGKLRIRAVKLARDLERIQLPEPHPLFRIVPGKVRIWEQRPSEKITIRARQSGRR